MSAQELILDEATGNFIEYREISHQQQSFILNEKTGVVVFLFFNKPRWFH